MRNYMRYTIVTQNGRPVIRAVPVPRRIEESSLPTTTAQDQAEEQTTEATAPRLRRIRRFRILDIR
ncbi:hypothetical protein [Thermorudis peleae]|uniref:hypothetical protein n=1 Tax=Thermorudis peleae TaxID=1382356 RepID=UPI00056F000E|nr:hypothetical protein [Thermorudis peleae]